MVLALIPVLAFAKGMQIGKMDNLSLPVSSQQQKKEDAELLARALDYFVSRKYHECLILLERLDKTYRLNPRYKAYLGVCYYYEWDYEQTIRCLDPVIPQLENFAPQERSFYCWADAESHFGLHAFEAVSAPELPEGFAYYPEGVGHLLAPELRLYDPVRDSVALKQCPDDFERLRGNYPLRREGTL